jgi:hypothetical protein
LVVSRFSAAVPQLQKRSKSLPKARWPSLALFWGPPKVALALCSSTRLEETDTNKANSPCNLIESASNDDTKQCLFENPPRQKSKNGQQIKNS